MTSQGETPLRSLHLAVKQLQSTDPGMVRELHRPIRFGHQALPSLRGGWMMPKQTLGGEQQQAGGEIQSRVEVNL